MPSSARTSTRPPPARVTDHYGIAGEVPFVDVAIHRDNRLFVDPSAIRNDPSQRGRAAHQLLLDFFTEVLRCRTSSAAADHSRGRALLQNLNEPNQTRLGMSGGHVAGHGVGDGIGDGIWDELATNLACRAAALTRVEDLRLFVDNVGDDLVSDLTTRVVFEVLVDFTHEMMRTYPTLDVGASTADVEVWDRTTRQWGPSSVRLPHGGAHQLLLVPRNWVWPRMLMSPRAFYNRYGTGTVQLERTTYTAEGRPLRPSKKQLQEENPHVRELNNDRAAKHMRDGDDLVERYRHDVDEAFEPMTPAQVAQRT